MRFALSAWLLIAALNAAGLSAGVAKVDVTNREAGPVNDPLYVKALVLKNGTVTTAIITVDAVALEEIGPIPNSYLPTVRSRIESELGIEPSHVLVNASHCHGVVCDDVAERTVRAVMEAADNMVPVKVGAGTGHEDRVSINRRLELEKGEEADVRRAYALPPDEAIAEVGPIDPEIGVLRLDKQDGEPLAAVYNFACHPIQGVPSGGNTADLTGFASTVIEDNLGEDAIALFLQGCAGDINPVMYKAVDRPPNAEILGSMLGLSSLEALRKVETTDDDRLEVLNETIELPRADLAPAIAELEAEQARLVQSFKGTSLNLKTFMQLTVKYSLSPEFPSYYKDQYLHDRELGRHGLDKLDAQNRQDLERYVENIHTMEELTRVQTNLALLRKHQASNQAADKPTISAEVLGLRIGEFVLVTFPGELTVPIGLNIKEQAPHDLTFVAGYTNGYLYYAPTAEQLKNVGGAQEDSECLLAPEWQAIFEEKAGELLDQLQ